MSMNYHDPASIDIAMLEGQVSRRLETLGYTLSESIRWRNQPHPQLDGLTPSDAIKINRAADVHAVLDRLEAGAYL